MRGGYWGNPVESAIMTLNRVNKPTTDGPADGLGRRERAQLFTRRAQVNLDRSVRNSKYICDILLRFSGCDPLQNLDLTGRKYRLRQNAGQRFGLDDMVVQVNGSLLQITHYLGFQQRPFAVRAFAGHAEQADITERTANRNRQSLVRNTKIMRGAEHGIERWFVAQPAPIHGCYAALGQQQRRIFVLELFVRIASFPLLRVVDEAMDCLGDRIRSGIGCEIQFVGIADRIQKFAEIILGKGQFAEVDDSQGLFSFVLRRSQRDRL